MILPNLAAHQSLLEDQLERRLFTRRTDLTSGIRSMRPTNALHAIMNGARGTITHLADEYQLSRIFVFTLVGKLKDAGQFLFVEIKDLSVISQSQRKAKPRLLDYYFYFVRLFDSSSCSPGSGHPVPWTASLNLSLEPGFRQSLPE